MKTATATSSSKRQRCDCSTCLAHDRRLALGIPLGRGLTQAELLAISPPVAQERPEPPEPSAETLEAEAALDEARLLFDEANSEWQTAAVRARSQTAKDRKAAEQAFEARQLAGELVLERKQAARAARERDLAPWRAERVEAEAEQRREREGEKRRANEEAAIARANGAGGLLKRIAGHRRA